MIRIFQDELTNKEQTSLKTHKYKTIDRSLLSFLVFRRYTAMILNYTPTYIAPNLLTMIGYFAMLTNFLVILVFDPSLREGSPLLSLFSAICLLIYFTADNIDGAQARKLNEMSPMGQMFDHGVDSCCVFFCLIALISSFGLGLTFTSLMLICCVMSGFYLSGLEEKFTGIFEFGYISGPTEGLVLIFIFHLMAAFYKEHVEKIIIATTLSPQVSQSLNISNVSPLFLLCFFVAIFNILSSYWKSCRLGDLKSKTVVTKCYLKTALVFFPLFILHKKLDYSPKLQMINLLIFSQCFSLNYIEDVFSTIVNSSKRRRNWVFIAYLMFCLSLIFFDVDNYSLGLYSFLTISLSHYVYNVFLLVKLCKKSLKINVFTLNRKVKTQ